ncbi:hypothetical protein ACN27F_11405 [Solwaraspora sp. WMMB335]|uniref:hypothetical protein n=1 Tax=Solwaraspora sp. WMMB335 TaxID=3404118 RepID=UPI003B93C7FE
MRTRRLTTAGLGVVATLALALTGCAGTTTTGSSTSESGAEAGTEAGAASDQDDAREALTAAAAKLNEDTVRVAMTLAMGADGSMEATGAMDPANRRGRFEIHVAVDGELMKIEMIMLEQDMYLQLAGDEMAELADVWMHIDRSKLPEGSSFDMMPQDDPAGAEDMVRDLIDIEWTGDDTLAGTIDMTKSPTADPEMIDALGEGADSVPFTATLDDEGRLVEMIIETSSLASEMGDMETRYSGFGEPVDVQAPTDGEIMPLPDAMLGMFDA